MFARLAYSFVSFLVISVCAASFNYAQDSNRNDVRKHLEAEGWRVVWGKNFTEADWAQGTLAISESVGSGNPGPFMAWFDAVLEENVRKIVANLRDIGEQDVRNMVVQSLKSGSIVNFQGFQLHAGFATYNRWKRVVVEVPDGVEFQGIKSKIKMKKIENEIPLPNWHQFYFRYRFGNDVPEQGQANNGTAPVALFRIKSAWTHDFNGLRSPQYIHFEGPTISASPILDGWLSAQWEFEPVSEVEGRHIFRIRNAWKRDSYINIERGGLECGPILPGWQSAWWEFEKSPSYDLNRIKNVYLPRVYLNTQSGNIVAGEVEPGWLSACWTIERTK